MTFDEAAAEWVRQCFPGADPVVGTVSFMIDWAAYDSGPRYCDFDVNWEEERVVLGPKYVGVVERSVLGTRTVDRGETPGHGDYDVTTLIREITDLATGASRVNPTGDC